MQKNQVKQDFSENNLTNVEDVQRHRRLNKIAALKEDLDYWQEKVK